MHKILGQDQKQCFELRARDLSMREILTLPSVGLLLGLYFLVYLAFNFFYVAFPVYAATGIRWSLAQTGVFFSVLAFLMALVQGPVLARVSAIWSDRTRVLGGSFVLALSFLFFNSQNIVSIYVGAALLALGNGLMWPSLLAVLAKSANRNVQGTVQGFAGSLAAVASIVGLLIGGLLYSALGARVFVISGVLTFVTFAVAFAIPSARPASRKR